jgi:predicted anti-sigma-YlaC factor YlaD
MKHPDRKKLSAFLDGELPEEDRLRITEHLSLCEECRREIDRLTDVMNVLGEAPSVEPSPWFLTDLKRRIREDRIGDESRVPFLERVKRLWSPLIPAGATALLALSLFIGNIMGRVIYPTAVHAGTSAISETLLGSSAVEDFPEGSLGDAYADLLVGGGE